MHLIEMLKRWNKRRIIWGRDIFSKVSFLFSSYPTHANTSLSSMGGNLQSIVMCSDFKVEKCWRTCPLLEWELWGAAGAISFVVRNLIVPHSPNLKKKGEWRGRDAEQWHWEIVRNLAFRVKCRRELLFMLKFNPYKLDNIDRSCIPPRGSWKG